MEAVQRSEAELAAKIGATLGEGPVWVERDGCLWSVDIKAPRVHRFDPQSGQVDGWDAPAEVGWVLPADDGKFVAGLATGLHRFAPDSGAFTLLAETEPHLPGNRLNDATVDPAGRIWFGSMDNAESGPSGRFYRFDTAGVHLCGIPPCIVTNGPAVSPDGRTLYVVDTVGRTIDAWTILDGGALAEQRRFVTIAAKDGYPDGVCVDAEGGVWLGLWGGGAAQRYDRNGVPTDEVRFPVSNVTKVALGGPDGRTAYATTARQGLDPTALAGQPFAGDLFTFKVKVPGPPSPEIRLGNTV
ncbi:MAG: SMP-30/gluconolactonase/LRE family protein [Sphingomonas sp.]|nr:SMP-30/gluconolactonase/LRE family protein [Sphingomonas sp.]